MVTETQQAIIISAWPCAGKTTFAQTWADHTVFDLDSSAYDLKSPAGTKSYVDDIEKRSQDSPSSIILVSSHAEVRRLLKEKDLRYVAVCFHELEDWEERQKGRITGDHDLAQKGLLRKGISEWDSWEQNEAGEDRKVVLKREQYLGSLDVVGEILEMARASN
ncbi:hypothetical protein diail_7466 [Diaporthe ilicicola]|nr:hypothetical protein diail_7466 [Diaporthe ilicicola]